MSVINSLLKFILGLLGKLLPALNVPLGFMSSLDGMVSFFIQILRTASFFVPLDVLVICLTVMFVVDNFVLLSRVVQYILKLVRG